MTKDNFNCPDKFSLHFSSSSDNFVIDLTKNEHLISDRYFQIIQKEKDQADYSGDSDFHRNNQFLNLNDLTSNKDHCHYHGYSGSETDTISAISVVNHSTLSGYFHYRNQDYFLHANPSNSTTHLEIANKLCSPQDPHVTQANSSQAPNQARPKRASISQQNPPTSANYVRHPPYESNSSSLYVELLIVHDHSQYEEYQGDTLKIAERSLQIVNIMNAFYKQLNVFIALVGVVLWIEKDEIVLTDDGDATLTNFLKYRHDKLLSRYHHDSAQLITNTSFNGSVVGKALKGPICTFEHSGGVNTDHSSSPAIVAVTLAHELGHNIGMEHDDDEKCRCPDEKCIMSSSSSAVHPKYWSSCSIDYFQDARKHGLLDCLKNVPEKIFGPTCGNGFVEEGEDCDLGEPLPTFGSSKSKKPETTTNLAQGTIVNTCCNRKTCKFAGNATCAQGPCCDISRCSLFNSTEKLVCRPKKNECDLEEVCDGSSEYCPDDVHFHDGIECSNDERNEDQSSDLVTSMSRSQAYCYRGQCSSHASQCKLLWGATGYVSRDICYEQNAHGNRSGHCGYDRLTDTYESCEPENTLCGMLHCVHNQSPPPGEQRKTGKLSYGLESASVLSVSYFVKSNMARIYCYGAIIDAGPDMRDPALVPNGAACGRDRMCINQKCVPVYDVINENWCPSDCNGNGICDNVGVCHCYDGTIGTSCYHFFGRNFQLSLFLYMMLFFAPIIAILVFAVNHYKRRIKVWWFLHNRKVQLRDKGRAANTQRRLPHDLKEGKLVISDPIPLNQHNNVNRPFYEPPIDPWAETSCETGVNGVTLKSPGYRLEPLGKLPIPSGTSVVHQHEHQAQLDSNSSNLKPG